ncbi:hypothetical protein ACIRL2_46075 [Embleya sp. NPDC127516]|uniref:hypothetical protein n=1 Tax=Embleya sp. NPDC127516 TaxID=3363990 RepID=UPI0038241AD7
MIGRRFTTSTVPDVDNPSDVNARAVALFGRHEDGTIAWPYGIADPPRRNHRTRDDADAAFEAALRGRRDAQRILVAWARRHGRRPEDLGCCPQWLRRRGSAGCPYGECDRWRWTDHVTTWSLDGQPVALTAAPYGMDEDERAELEEWVEEYPDLAVAYGTGWYGADTTQVLLWRRDRIRTLACA